MHTQPDVGPRLCVSRAKVRVGAVGAVGARAQCVVCGTKCCWQVDSRIYHDDLLNAWTSCKVKGHPRSGPARIKPVLTFINETSRTPEYAEKLGIPIIDTPKYNTIVFWETMC